MEYEIPSRHLGPEHCLGIGDFGAIDGPQACSAVLQQVFDRWSWPLKYNARADAIEGLGSDPEE